MNLFTRNFRYWVPALLWLVVIALESLKLSSALTGAYLWELLRLLHIRMSAQTFAEFHHLLRKTGHVTGYGILSLLLFRAWYHSFSSVRLSGVGDSAGATRSESLAQAGMTLRLRCSILALGMTLMSAVLDEWHQSFDPARTSSIWDVGLDITGGIVFLAVALFVFKLWSGRTEELQTVPA